MKNQPQNPPSSTAHSKPAGPAHELGDRARSEDRIGFIEEQIRAQGFEHFGWTPLEKPLSFSFYKQWLEQDYQGEMQYLKTHLPHKEQPQLLLPNAQSVLIIAQPYHPHPKGPSTYSQLPIALYAQGEDYHFWFRARLQKIADSLKARFSEDEFLAATDSSPVLERDLAYRAGLGWVGKNTCIIDEKRGSLFFIGEILTTLQLQPRLGHAADRCGSCTRCLDVCPTGALIEPRKLDARKCISYLTIEKKTDPPAELLPLMKDFFYGCDLCQTVCPWNQKVFGKELIQSHRYTDRQTLIEELTEVLTLSSRALQRKFEKTPLNRAPAWRHRRNAIVFAANHDLHELKATIEKLSQDERLADIARWALKKMSGPSI